MKGILSLRGFRKLRTGAIVATGVFLFATSNVQVVQASEEDGVWEARTVEQVKADIASLAKDSNYVIKWGDTLSVISEATGISMDALAQMNQITNVNLIYAHNELGFTQPISTTAGNQTVSKQTVTVVNRQNKQEEVKAFEVTTKEDTQSGKTETVVTEVKPTTKEEKTVPKTEQALVVTAKEEASKVNQTLVSSQPTEKQSTIGKAETPKVDQTPTTTAKVEAKKSDQAPAVVNPAKTPVTTETKETTTSKSTEEKKQTEGTTPKETTEGKIDSKEATLPTEKTSKGNITSEVAPMPAAESEGKAESSVPTTNGEENTTVEKKTEPKTDQSSVAVKPAETSVTTETKETTTSKSTEEKKQTEGTTPKETTEGKIDSKEATLPTEKTSKGNITSEVAPMPAAESEGKAESPAQTTNGEENITAEKKTEPKTDQAPTAVNPTETPVTTEIKETTPSKPTEEKEDKQTEQPTTNTPSKDSVEDHTIAPSTNNSSNEGSKHEEEKKDETVVPEEDTKANKEALESHKQNKLDEINKSSLSPEQKEQAISKVKELTANAEKAIEGAATSEDQAKVVDQYENNLAAIETPSVETPKPDFTKPVESHNPTGSTTIGEGGAISTLASSTPAASTPAVSESAANTPVVSEPVVPSAPAESAPATSVPTASAPATSAPATGEPAASTSEASAPATSAPTIGEPATSAPATSTPSTGAPTASTSTTTNPSVSAASTSNTSPEHTGFRNAPVYQPRVVRRARSVDAPKDQIAIYYNFGEMKDIAGFLGDPGNSIITVPAGATSDEIRTIVKDKIDAKKAELAKRGYTFMDDYFVDKPQEDTIRYDYVVNFTKAASASTSVASAPVTSASAPTTPVVSEPVAPSAPATSTPSTGAPAASISTTTNPLVPDASTSNTSSEHTGFRNAPVYQPRVVRRARSVDAPKDQIAIYYNFGEMKDIAGFLGDPGNSIITVPAGATSDEIRTIVKDKIDAKKAELAKRGYTFMDDYFVDKPQEDTIRYDYVVNFTKAASASTSVASAPVTSASAPTTPVVSEPVAPSAPATSTPSTGAPAASISTTTNPLVPDASTSNTSSEHTGFRNAPVYQPRVVRRARSVDAPKDQIAIYYNFGEMKDIAGFLGDPGNSIITVPAGATSDEIRTIVKDKIDAKKAELAKRGYTFMDDYFVDKPQEDTIRYDYVVNFTKAASLRVAPVSQPRAARNRRSVVESPVKTRTITFYYQLAGLEIAGALGTPGKNYVITVPETASTTEIQQAIDDATRSEKAELGRFFKYVRETNLQTDILDRGFGNFDYVITFTR